MLHNFLLAKNKLIVGKVLPSRRLTRWGCGFNHMLEQRTFSFNPEKTHQAARVFCRQINNAFYLSETVTIQIN